MQVLAAAATIGKATVLQWLQALLLQPLHRVLWVNRLDVTSYDHCCRTCCSHQESNQSTHSTHTPKNAEPYAQLGHCTQCCCWCLHCSCPTLANCC